MKYIKIIISIILTLCIFSITTYSLSKFGSKSQEVVEIQTKLKRWGYYNGEIDGIFGTQTKNAVISFQKKNGLVADGIVGPLTWKALYDAYLGIVSTVPIEYSEGNIIPFQGVVLRLGSDSDEVRVLQEYLNYVARSFPSIPTVSVTGYFGPRTRESVIAFQEVAGLPVNGQVSA